MQRMNVIIADSKGWFQRRFKQGDYENVTVTFISSSDSLTLDYLKNIKPEFIFFVHWNSIVSAAIHEKYKCIVFHVAPLPYGRGGSPIQNLIIRGFKSAPVCALKMTDKLDAGPIYLREEISLAGQLSDIFGRIYTVSFKMIGEILQSPYLEPIDQVGEPLIFTRLRPEDNNIDFSKGLDYVFDQIRMVDGFDYPKAFIRRGGFKINFSNVSKKGDIIYANALIFTDSHKETQGVLSTCENLQFTEVDSCTESHIHELYKLLNHRQHNISHTGTVNYNDHAAFVQSNPYVIWYLIEYDSICIGSVYINDDNSVGIDLYEYREDLLANIISFVVGKHSPLPAIKSKRSGKFFINIPYNDCERQCMMMRIGAKPIQTSFII